MRFSKFARSPSSLIGGFVAVGGVSLLLSQQSYFSFANDVKPASNEVGAGQVCFNNSEKSIFEFFVSKVKDNLPTYTMEDVSSHKTKETGIWVTYRDGVYDITEFIEAHPGGHEKILLAAGDRVDPFWQMYQQHESQVKERRKRKREEAEH